MTLVITTSMGRATRRLALSMALLLTGCSALQPSTHQPVTFYSLDDASLAVIVLPPRAGAPSLVIEQAHASAGFDSSHIIYLRQPHRVEYFAQSEWVEPPARMLTPMLVSSLAASGGFRAVMSSPGAGAGDLRLDTEIIRLQHEFDARPSRVRFTLRAWLVQGKTRQVVAWRDFDTSVPAISEDAAGGVQAANQAVRIVLDSLAQFLKETAP
jgi:cholesterol transport system auxiliary component